MAETNDDNTSIPRDEAELLPCPFCGVDVTLDCESGENPNDSFINHPRSACILGDKMTRLWAGRKGWNTRATNETRIAEQVARIATLERAVVLAEEETATGLAVELAEAEQQIAEMKRVLAGLALTTERVTASAWTRVAELEAALREIIGEELSGESNPNVKDENPVHSFCVDFGMLRRARKVLAEKE